MTYLALAVIFLHLAVMPITLRIGLFIDTDRDEGRLSVRLFFIPVFVKNIDLKRLGAVLRGEDYRLREDAPAEEKPQKKAKGKGRAFDGALFGYLLRFCTELVKRVRVRRLDVDAAIGIGDAAATAVAVGAVSSFYGQILALTDGAGASRGNIAPDYDTERIYTDTNGIISLCFADIIYAAVKAVKFDKKEKRTYAGYISDRA